MSGEGRGPRAEGRGAEGVREFEVARIKRSADPAPNNDSTPNENQCRIGVAALLDAVYGRMPTSRDTEFPDTIE